MTDEKLQCLVPSCSFETTSFKGRGQHMGLTHSKEERKPALIQEVTRLREKLNKPPAVSDLAEHAKVGRDMFENVFGSWESALNSTRERRGELHTLMRRNKHINFHWKRREKNSTQYYSKLM